MPLPLRNLRGSIWRRRSAVLLAAMFLATLPLQAQHFSVALTFNGNTSPNGDLIIDNNGVLYGTTSNGGTNLEGSIYQLDSTTNGFTSLYSFMDGNDQAFPMAGVVRDAAGNLYGTNTGGNNGNEYGVIFKLDTSNHISVLHTFTGGSDGADPNGLLMDKSGALYGTAFGGGDENGDGTVFEFSQLARPHRFNLLYTFTGGLDGSGPDGGLVTDSTGAFFGTTSSGGKYHAGVLFRITRNFFAENYYFTGGNDGGDPVGRLLLDSAGYLYGAARSGGAGASTGGYGTLFKFNTQNGEYAVLYRFSGGSDGRAPNGSLIMDSAGLLYGTTFGDPSRSKYGTVYKFDPVSGKIITLYSFKNQNDGAFPNGGLVMDKSGNLYGTTTVSNGGAGAGTLFKITPN